MDTIRKYFGFFVLGYTSHFLCYCPVGEQHEFFHQLVGILGLFEVYADRFSLFVDFKLHLVAVEVDGSCCETFLTKCFGDGVQHENFFFKIARFRFDDLLRLFVSEATVGVDDGMYDAGVFYFSFLGDVEDDGECEFLFIRTQGADEVTQRSGSIGMVRSTK